MNSPVTIDGRSLDTWGAYVTTQGLCQLVAPPPLKSPTTYDWPEEDGTEADLAAPLFDTRTIEVAMAVRGSSPQPLIDALSDGAYHTWQLAGCPRPWRLRLTGQSGLRTFDGLTTFTLRLADDTPPASEELQYVHIAGHEYPCRGYALDGVDLGHMGLCVTEGTHNSILSLPDVKAALSIKTDDTSGALYDAHSVRYKARDIQVNMFTHQPERAALWGCFDSLIGSLASPGLHSFTVTPLGLLLTVYYKSCTVKEYWWQEGWLAFTLTLTVVKCENL